MTTRRHSWLATAGPDGPLLQLRPPTLADGAGLHELIRLSPPLDLNSCYAYLLQGLHFADTCVVACKEACDGLTFAGYISGYIPPGHADTLFIWQVAVSPAYRGHGLARAMLKHLLDRPACQNVRWLETTVAPDNIASAKLFQGLARELDCPCVVSELFPRSAFGADSSHEAEPLFRIGPFHHEVGHSEASTHPNPQEETHDNQHLRAP